MLVTDRKLFEQFEFRIKKNVAEHGPFFPPFQTQSVSSIINIELFICSMPVLFIDDIFLLSVSNENYTSLHSKLTTINVG